MSELEGTTLASAAGSLTAAVLPRVSVVMPSLDQARFIGEAIDSVLGQPYSALELIVIDGGSTDGTQDILAHYAAQSGGRLRWESGRDGGPAEAVNKGIAQCLGDIIGWLNADDLYAPGALPRAVEALQENPHWLLVYGHARHIDEHGRDLEPYPTRTPDAGINAFASGCFISQPTVFFRKRMVDAIGPLDASLRTAFDLEWWLRLYANKCVDIGFVDAVQAFARQHRASITCAQRETVLREGMMLLARHLGAAPLGWFKTYMAELRVAVVRGERDAREATAQLNAFADSVESYLALPDGRRMRRLLAGSGGDAHQRRGQRLDAPRIPAWRRALAGAFSLAAYRLRAQARRIRAAGVFDEGWYLERYPDVACAGIDPIVHYLRHGAREGRNPSPRFDTLAYLRAHPESGRSGSNPLLHYLDSTAGDAARLSASPENEQPHAL